MHSEEIEKNFDKCIDLENVHGIVDGSRNSSWARFLIEFGNLREHKIREHRECVQHHSQSSKRTFRRNSECEAWNIHHHHGRDQH